MKSTLQILLVALLIGAVLAAPVAAATSQGLEWGVANGDRFTYQFTLNSDTDHVSEAMYFDVESIPGTIPNIVDQWSDLPILTIGGYWENGTSLGLYGLVFIFMFTTGSGFCVPIGNYTLLSELLLDEMTENVTTASTYYYWTSKYSGQSSGETVTVTTSYLKTDGFLAKYLVTAKNETDTVMDISVVRDGLPSDIVDLVMSNILIIGIGVVVLVIIGAVVCKKR